MRNAFFIVGPTAVGKTGLAVELAERCGAEIVSADAYQVYRGFCLLTAKPTPEEQRRIVHHLVGCVANSDPYNVARFLEDARFCIDHALATGKPVIVVGGNGLYVKALTHGLSPLPHAQPELRGELEGSTAENLFARLRALDPATASVIDVQNKRRLVRALEVCLLTGRRFSDFRTEWQAHDSAIPIRGAFLFRDRLDLARRIDERVEKMFAQGVVEEVRSASAGELSPTAKQILGLAEIKAHLAGELDSATCRERIKIATRQYAKRQITWFKRETCFEPVDLSAFADVGRALDEVHSRLLSWQNVTRSINLMPAASPADWPPAC